MCTGCKVSSNTQDTPSCPPRLCQELFPPYSQHLATSLPHPLHPRGPVQHHPISFTGLSVQKGLTFVCSIVVLETTSYVSLTAQGVGTGGERGWEAVLRENPQLAGQIARGTLRGGW